jgi:hypothetical protein
LDVIEAMEEGLVLVIGAMLTEALDSGSAGLVLKCARTLPDERLSGLAATAGIEERRLRELIATLREMRMGREKRLVLLRHRASVIVRFALLRAGCRSAP